LSDVFKFFFLFLIVPGLIQRLFQRIASQKSTFLTEGKVEGHPLLLDDQVAWDLSIRIDFKVAHGDPILDICSLIGVNFVASTQNDFVAIDGIFAFNKHKSSCCQIFRDAFTINEFANA